MNQRGISQMKDRIYLLNIFVGIVFMLAPFLSKAQNPHPHDVLFINDGARVWIDSGLVVQITGNTITQGPASLLHNEGELYVHFDSTYLLADRGFTIDNGAVVDGNGYYEIEPDWTNNSPNFIPGESHVHLMSDEHQLITGTNSTRFYHLEVSGDGVTGLERVKSLTIDATVLDSLTLNNRELATDSFNLFIQNTEPSAIARSTAIGDEGFVSSLTGDLQSGALFWRMANSQTPYFFPTGSSVNPPTGDPYIIRPVSILPENNSITTFSVRFIHESPDLRGFDQFSLDDSTCSVIPLFYHMVNHPSGLDAANVRIYYDPLTDEIYDNIDQWGNGQWNLQKNSQYIPSGNLFSVLLPDQKIFSQDSIPFILSDRIPGEPVIIGEPDVCSNDLAMLRAIGNTEFFDWQIPSSMEELSDPGEDTLIFRVFEESGYIQLSAQSASGKCVEAADSFLLSVNPGPEANFITNKTEVFTGEIINFRDSSLGSPSEWYWKLGDGNTGASPLLRHSYEDVGDFIVEMFVQDDNGCSDSTFLIVTVIEGIQVPNIFTPNGDGNNDIFYIPNSGIKEYSFKVFNRWGNILFETTAPEIAWDGRNNVGVEAAEGTYFYVLEAFGDNEEYVFKGSLTLLR